MLAALARGKQAQECQPAIVAALAAAIRDPASRRPVYVLEGEEIKYLGQGVGQLRAVALRAGA